MLKFDGSGRATGYCANIFERYEKRPTEHSDYEFNNMSHSEECVDLYESNLPTRRRFITLNDNSKLVVRNVPAVVRVPYFVAATDPENYYYSLLLQYMPYRSEIELLEEFDTARAAFLAREPHLRQTSEHMMIYRERDRQFENAFNQDHAFEILEQEPMQQDVEEEVPEQHMNDDQFQTA